MVDSPQDKQSPERIFLYGFSLVFMLLASVIIASLWVFHLHNQEIESAIRYQEQISHQVHKLRSIARQRGILLLSIINTSDPFDRDELTQEYNAFAREFLQIREALNNEQFKEHQKIAYDNALKIVSDLARIQLVALSHAENDDLVKAKQVANEKILPQKEKVQEAYDLFDESINKEIHDLLNHSQKTTKNSLLVSVSIIIISFAIALWISYYVYTYIKSSQNSLNQLNRVLSESDAIKTKFLSRLSHELFTPMNLIMGFTQLLLDRKKELNKEQTTSLNTILDASKRLNKLMNEVLNIQKVGKGNYQLNIESVNLLTLVNEIEKTFAPQISNKNISLDTSACDFMFGLETDKSYLKQILINLISNASFISKT